MKRCYLSDAIYGRDMDDVREQFDWLKLLARNNGFEPVSPLDILAYEHEGECPPGRVGTAPIGHTDTCNLRADIRAMLDCDAVLFGDRWQTSWGARAELQVAGVVGLHVFFAQLGMMVRV